MPLHDPKSASFIPLSLRSIFSLTSFHKLRLNIPVKDAYRVHVIKRFNELIDVEFNFLFGKIVSSAYGYEHLIPLIASYIFIFINSNTSASLPVGSSLIIINNILKNFYKFNNMRM